MRLRGDLTVRKAELADVLRAGREENPDEVALVSADSSWSWRELEAASHRYAVGLFAHGVRPGDRVATLMPNRVEVLIHYLGCLRAGFVATPLNYRYMPPEIDHALSLTEAVLLISHAERDEDLAACKEVPRLRLGVIRYASTDGRTLRFEDLLENDSGGEEPPTPASDDPAVIFFTSGSTGKPKGVTHSFETLGWVIAGTAQSLGLTAGDVVLPASSISHAGGHWWSMAGFWSGARVVLARTFDGDGVLPLLRAHRPTKMFMLPAMLVALVRDHGAVHPDFSSVRLCCSGGDSVSAELEREFAALAGFPIAELYATSEIGFGTLNAVSGNDGSVGPAAAGLEFSIRNDAGEELGAGLEGRLWARARSNMVGYWNDPEATADAVIDGWIDTGDVMKADERGYLWFCGRRKQIIVHDASNISPQEVEGALVEHPAVSGAGVVGVHDVVHGENVWAYVALVDGAERPTVQQLIEFARARVGYKAPEVIEVLDELPLNATGKVDRVRLKKVAEGHAHAGATI